MNKTNLGILFFTMVVIMLGFGIIIPIMPFYVEQYGASGTELGMLMAVFSIMQFIFAPVWGGMSDRYGRKWILIIGALGNAISHLIFGFATNLGMMFLSRILAGILSSATFPTAMAFISDSTDEENRGGGMGIIGASFGVGMVLGPGIGGWLGGQNLSTPFFLASALSLAAAILIWIILPESLPKEKRQPAGGRLRGPQLGEMWRSLFGPIGFLLILAFLVNYGLANFEGIFGLYAKHRYNFGPAQVGTLLTVVGLVSALLQGLLTGPAIRKLGEEQLIKISLFASVLGFVFMVFTGSSLAYLTVNFFVISNTMLRPSISSLVSKRAEGGQGIALGMSSSFESLGRVVGPLWAGTLFDVNINLPYLSAAVIMLIAFGLSLFKMKRPAPLQEAALPATATE